MALSPLLGVPAIAVNKGIKMPVLVVAYILLEGDGQ